MTDRELLELAAKAAGYDVKPHVNYKISKDLVFMYKGSNWNPLTDDGDALRLAVKLNMNVDIVDGDTGAQVIGVCFTTENNLHDKYAATRRAIVRAAAEIGKTK